MPLMVAGDFTWPTNTCVNLDEIVEEMSTVSLVLNFEGAFVENDPTVAAVANSLKYNLFSGHEAIGVLNRLNVIALGLANNHIGDYLGACANTLNVLEQAGLKYFGIKRNPCCDIDVNGVVYRIIGVASPLTEITSDCDGLAANTFDPDETLKLIVEWRRQSPNLKIVVFIHWGYELARYPLPADRAWAHKAVAAGANYIIGHHPHVVQGIEKVEGGIVAYSLGNFVLPQIKYRDKCLSYTDTAVFNQLAVSLEDDPLLVWSQYIVSDQSIVFDGKERLSTSARIAELTPFSGMTEREYYQWFNNARSSGKARMKRSFVVIRSYFGIWKLHYFMALQYLWLRRTIRLFLIKSGLHRPYNW